MAVAPRSGSKTGLAFVLKCATTAIIKTSSTRLFACHLRFGRSFGHALVRHVREEIVAAGESQNEQRGQKRKRYMKSLSGILVSILVTGVLSAQTELASLTGLVTDSTGGVLSQVEVTAVNQATNLAYTAHTSAEGRYAFSSLRPGVYRVSATAAGFKQQVSSGVTLQVN